VTTIPTLAQRLKEATSDLHRETEARLYSERILASKLTLAEYRHLLRTHYAFHAPLERALRAHETSLAAIDPGARRKSALLEADLRAVAAGVPAIEARFDGWTLSELLGAGYVAEGSTLGGAVIARCLLKDPALAQEIAPLRFFGAYGAETGPRWKTFCQFLAEQPPAVERPAVEGARRAFVIFQELFEQTR
jgi:heme oxygenase